jgi:hypothetical protein
MEHFCFLKGGISLGDMVKNSFFYEFDLTWFKPHFVQYSLCFFRGLELMRLG